MKHPLLWTGFSAAVIGALVLGWISLKQNADYYLTPGMLSDDAYPTTQFLRLGGVVAVGSLESHGLAWNFDLEDGTARTRIRVHGTLPALFKEGQGAIAEGRFDVDGIFEAERVLARHDQYYRPPPPTSPLIGTP